MKSDRGLTIPTCFHSTRLRSIHGCRITSGKDERLKKERSLKRPVLLNHVTESLVNMISLAHPISLTTIAFIMFGNSSSHQGNGLGPWNHLSVIAEIKESFNLATLGLGLINRLLRFCIFTFRQKTWSNGAERQMHRTWKNLKFTLFA